MHKLVCAAVVTLVLYSVTKFLINQRSRKLKKSRYIFPFALLVLVLLATSCGYRSPYVYTGPGKAVYITSWKNRTSELQLESDIYQSLVEWYQKSDSLKVVKTKNEADLILAGEIVSIDLPSLSYGTDNTTREVKLRLRVRYILKDIESGNILFQEPNQLRSEEYTVGAATSTDEENEDEALETIIDEMSQEIYLRTLSKLQKL